MGLRVSRFFYLGLHFLISQIKGFGWISNFPTSFSFGHVILIKIHRNPGCKRHKQVASQNEAGLGLWESVSILSPFFGFQNEFFCRKQFENNWARQSCSHLERAREDSHTSKTSESRLPHQPLSRHHKTGEQVKCFRDKHGSGTTPTPGLTQKSFQANWWWVYIMGNNS